jgi:drug/metabolite transporter (DMT)-like permease
MLWFWLAILTAALWAVSNIIDKVLVSRHIKNPTSYVIFTLYVQLAYITFLGGIFSLNFVWPMSLYALGIGALFAIAAFLYWKAMKAEEASRVISLSYLIPFVVAVLAALTLGEILTPYKYVGIALLVSSALLVSFRKIEDHIHVSPALATILIAVVLWGAVETAEKWALGSLDIISLLFYMMLGASATLSPLLLKPATRAGFRQVLGMKKRMLAMGFASELFTMLGSLAFFKALTYGQVSLVAALTSLQPTFVLLFAILLSALVPHILKEDIGRKTLIFKAIAVALIIAGAYLIA